MPFAVIRVTIFWDRDEPDGSECICCGDKCYLTMWRAFVSSRKIAERMPLDLVLCESCHQAAMEDTAEA